jgi:hypothetical protein
VHRLLPCTGTVTSPPEHLIRPSSEVRHFLTGLDVVSNGPIGLAQDQMPEYLDNGFVEASCTKETGQRWGSTAKRGQALNICC